MPLTKDPKRPFLRARLDTASITLANVAHSHHRATPMNIRDFLALTRVQRLAVRRQIIIDDLKRLSGCEVSPIPMKRIN